MQLVFKTWLIIISQLPILFQPTKMWICCSLPRNYITQLSDELGRKYTREWTFWTIKCEGSTDTLDLHNNSIPQTLFVCLCIYRGADKSLARPGMKQATATEDFDFHISYL